MIYKLILLIRDLRYRNGRHSVTPDVPSICVGNITVGGTGKTPHTEMILSSLLASGRFLSPAVLSRGYKRKSKGFRIVPADGTAVFYGDEPLQIKRKFPAATVAVDKDRLRACGILAHPERTSELKKWQGPEFPAADVIILDDAFQYRRLKAGLSLVLSPWQRPVSTDSLLPGGRLRDLKRRLYEPDIVIVTKCPYELTEEEKQEHARTLGFSSFSPATCTATHGKKSLTLLFSGITYGRPQPVFPEGDSRYTYAEKAVLFTGIADDTPLRNYLSDSYRIVAHQRFPDHRKYTRADIRTLLQLMKHNPTAAFITTEKDAVRLQEVKEFPAALRSRLFYIPITTGFLSEHEKAVFDKHLNQL